MSEKDFIPITQTPYVTKLTKDYLLGKNIGINNPLVQDYEQIISKAEQRKFATSQRIELAETLLAQYKNSGIELSENSKVYKNILDLKKLETFTFTTGQQIHIFLGPLFYIYKIQSLLRHVANFNNKSSKIKAVPVFWMASEDHDLEEINSVKLYGEVYKWGAEPGNAVGRISCKGLPELIDQLEQRADKTDENLKLYALFKKHYQKNKTLASATQSLLHEVFEKDGLIVLNPDDKNLKKHFLATAKKEIEEKVLHSSYNQQNKLLKKQGYETKVNAQEINYFWLEDNRRIKLKIIPITIGTKIIKVDSGEELNLNSIIKNFEKLSPNVLTRPIYQESVLPNLVYIGGSAEIDYWLPLQDSFIKLGLSFPALLQRDSLITMSKKNKTVIDKAKLIWHFLFESEVNILKNYNQQSNTKSLVFSKKFQEINSILESLKTDSVTKEINSPLVFKTFNEIQKRINYLSKLTAEEELKYKINDPLLKNILKIRDKIFVSKQERDVYFIDNPINKMENFIEYNEFKSVMKLLLV